MLSPIAFLLLHQPGSLGTTALLLICLQTEPVRQENEAKTRPASVRTVQPAAQASGTSPQSSAGCSRPCATPSDSEGFRQHRNVNWKGEAMNQNLDEQSTVASLGSSRAGLKRWKPRHQFGRRRTEHDVFGQDCVRQKSCISRVQVLYICCFVPFLTISSWRGFERGEDAHLLFSCFPRH